METGVRVLLNIYVKDAYLVCHQGGHGPSDLVMVDVHVGGWGEGDEDEPDRKVQLACLGHHHRVGKPQEGHGWF